MKLKLIALAGLLAAGSAQAALDTFATGNGSVALNFRLYDTAAGNGDQSVSAAFDLGMNLQDFLNLPTTYANVPQTFSRTWDLVNGTMTTVVGGVSTGPVSMASYGTTWAGLLNAATTSGMTATGGSVLNRIEFNVIAGDTTDDTLQAGGARYLSTGDASFSLTSNANVILFGGMDDYYTANNGLSSHNTAANGASLVAKGAGDAYFGTTGPLNLQGDAWLTTTAEDTTKQLHQTQSFWFITNSAVDPFADATNYRLGYDLNNDGDRNDTGEFGVWSVNAAAGTITYSTAVAAPVPEPETYALMLAGLGLVAYMARRRRAV